MKIYNTLTRKKEAFEPRIEGKVSMYVCGPTVYNYIHVGNARTFLSFDVIRRYLTWRGYDVSFIQNITDIDDKIIQRAAEEGRSSAEIAQFYTDAFVSDMRAVGVEDPDVRPKATESIPQMIELIEHLIAIDHAYALDSGDVYFSVRSFADYGKLSGRDIDDLMHGTRKELDIQKRDPLDFALWKSAKPVEPSWDSPWGQGRPGWHIECSAMSDAELGIPFDIHGGGVDLVFPHHENEIAQTEAATGKKMAHYWLHGGMLQTSGEKMSKSLGNFMLLHDVLDVWQPNAIRLLMLQTHYRSPLDFSEERLKEAATSFTRIQAVVDRMAFVLEKSKELKDKRQIARSMFPSETSTNLQSAYREAAAAYQTEMDDDFNTAAAVGHLFELVREINAFLDTAITTDKPALDEDELIALEASYEQLIELFSVLGINLTPSTASTIRAGDTSDADTATATAEIHEAQDLLEERSRAREAKDWTRADEIRDELDALGFVIKDTPQGPQFVKK